MKPCIIVTTDLVLSVKQVMPVSTDGTIYPAPDYSELVSRAYDQWRGKNWRRLLHNRAKNIDMPMLAGTGRYRRELFEDIEMGTYGMILLSTRQLAVLRLLGYKPCIYDHVDVKEHSRGILVPLSDE